MQKLIYSQVHKQLIQDFRKLDLSQPIDEERLLYTYLTYIQRHADNRTLARRMLLETGSLANLIQLPPYALMRTFGLSEIVAVGISSLGSIAVRIQQNTKDKQLLNTVPKLYEHFKSYFLTGNYEITAVTCLNKRLQYLCTETCTLFDPKQTTAAESLLLTIARKNFADKLVIAHNHPTVSVLDLSPSTADHTMTDRLQAALSANGITLVEHILMAYDGCCPMIHGDLLPYLDPEYHNLPQLIDVNFDYSSIK